MSNGTMGMRWMGLAVLLVGMAQPRAGRAQEGQDAPYKTRVRLEKTTGGRYRARVYRDLLNDPDRRVMKLSECVSSMACEAERDRALARQIAAAELASSPAVLRKRFLVDPDLACSSAAGADADAPVPGGVALSAEQRPEPSADAAAVPEADATAECRALAERRRADRARMAPHVRIADLLAIPDEYRIPEERVRIAAEEAAASRRARTRPSSHGRAPADSVSAAPSPLAVLRRAECQVAARRFIKRGWGCGLNTAGITEESVCSSADADTAAIRTVADLGTCNEVRTRLGLR